MRNRTRLLALLFLCSATTAVRADEASEALVKSFIDKIDKQDAWSASATRISSEGSATVVEGLKIAKADGSADFDAATIRLDQLAETGNGGLKLTGFTANGLKLGGGLWSFTVPEASGRAITTAGFAGWSFDPKAPFTSLARLYSGLAQTEFDEIVIPQADFSQETGIAAKAHYSNFHLDGLKKGVLASESIERIESTTMTGTPEAVTTIFEGLSGKNFDLGALAHVFDPSAYAGGKGDGLWKTAFESAGYARIAAKTGEREVFTTGPISAGQWQVRQTAEPFAPLFDELLATGGSADPKFDKFMEDHVGELIGWFKIGTVSVKDIAASPPEGGKIALASATIEDLSAESMKRLAFDGFNAQGPEFAAKFQTFALADVTWPSISAIVTLAKLQEAKEAGRAPDPLLIDQAAGAFMNVVPRIGELKVSGVEVGIPGGEPFKLGEYTATSEGGMALLPKTAKMAVSGIVIPRSLLHMEPESGQIFDALGYSELLIDADGEADHDDATGRYSGQGRVAVKDAGALSLAHALGGLTHDRIKAIMSPFAMSPNGEPDEGQLLSAVGPLSIESFTLRFDDSSLMKRVLPLAAKMQGMDEATLIANTTAMMQLGLTQLGNQAFTSEVVNAVGAFLKDPKSLTLALRPAQPVTVQQLMGLDPAKPGAAIDLLGVHVTAND